MTDIECKECGAPAEAITTAFMNGVDYDGKDAVFEVIRFECVAGHLYDEMGAVVSY